MMNVHLLTRRLLAGLVAGVLALSMIALSGPDIAAQAKKNPAQKKKGDKKGGKKDDKKVDKKLPPEKKAIPKDKTPPLMVLKGHKDWINSVAISPNGQFVITASRDRTVKIWDLGSGKEVKSLAKHPTNVRAAVFSPDGKVAVTTTGEWDKKAKKWEGEIKFWDVSAGKLLRSVKGHGDAIESVAFSLDGKKLATGGDDNIAIIWDVASGKALQTLISGKDKGHKDKILAVAFNQDASRLATASADNTVKIWEVSTGKEVLTLKGTDRPMTCVAFSPDGKLIAAGSLDEHVYFWDNAGKEVKKLDAPEGIWSVAFNPKGTFLAASGWNDTLKVWNVSGNWAELFYRNGHERTVTGVVFSPDGSRLVSVGIDQTIKVWSVPGEKSSNK